MLKKRHVKSWCLVSTQNYPLNTGIEDSYDGQGQSSVFLWMHLGPGQTTATIQVPFLHTVHWVSSHRKITWLPFTVEKSIFHMVFYHMDYMWRHLLDRGKISPKMLTKGTLNLLRDNIVRMQERKRPFRFGKSDPIETSHQHRPLFMPLPDRELLATRMSLSLRALSSPRFTQGPALTAVAWCLPTSHCCPLSLLWCMSPQRPGCDSCLHMSLT